MKKFSFCILCVLFIFTLGSCSGKNDGKTEGKATNSNISESSTVSEKYADSEFAGVWYNADSAEEKVEFELNADGTATFRGESTGTWEPNDVDGITVKVTVDGKETTMNGYFVIAGEGFVARYNEENQHYIDDGEGEKQLEVMITENTCVDCIKQ